jgi:hypothetical protein
MQWHLVLRRSLEVVDDVLEDREGRTKGDVIGSKETPVAGAALWISMSLTSDMLNGGYTYEPCH